MIVSDMEKISSFQKIDSDSKENSDKKSENIQGDIVFIGIYDMREIDGAQSENNREYHRYSLSFPCKKHGNHVSYDSSYESYHDDYDRAFWRPLEQIDA